MAANLTLTGIFVAHSLWTRFPLWITIGGQTLPTALTKVNTVLVSPRLEGTLLNKGLFTSPRNFSSLGMFCTPVSSPDHIYSGDTMPNFFTTCTYSLNQCQMLTSLAAIAHAIDKFLACLTLMCGYFFRKHFSQVLPPILFLSLNPFIPLILAY